MVLESADTTGRPYMKYDYVIVGAGSAGAILATRLSEDPNINVLLLEAGPDYAGLEDLPEEVKYGYKSTTSIWDSEHNWQYKATSIAGNTIDIPRGKVTGGSSAINGTIFLRGIEEDYDDWAEAGNDKWGFQDLMPYFNKIETDKTYEDDPGDFHGSSGPIICVRYPEDTWLPGSRAFTDAALDAGFPFCEDANAPDTTGVGPLPLNSPDGIRWSTAIGYLGLSRHRLNLTIRANVLIKRVLFDATGDAPRATGVIAVSDGEEFTVEGDEIILTAGAIGTPQLLMLSGVGPQAHLEEFGIECVKDVPGVGQNLADHPLTQVTWKTKPTVELDPVGPRLQVLLRYTAEGSEIENDMIVYMQHAASRSRESRELGESFIYPDPIGISAGLGLNLALSKGELKLGSADYRDPPVLNYNMLDDEEDMRRYKDGIRMLVSLEDHPSMREIIESRPYLLDADLESDEALENWIKKNVGTGHHISCTAKMGPVTDPMAVTDQYGKVHGFEGLRLADASVMPECVRANINVTVMVIGERIADFIKQGH